MKYEEAWLMEDNITSAVNAVGCEVWDLHFDAVAELFHLELNDHLDETQVNELITQMPLQTDYDGEGSQGSQFTIYAE